MANGIRCENCVVKCPQAKMAHEIAKGRMYATNEFIALQKKVESGELAEVVCCSKCRYADPYERMDGKTGYYCLYQHNSFAYGQGWCFHPVKEADDFCSYGEKKGGASGGEREAAD